jgi:galactokinase
MVDISLSVEGVYGAQISGAGLGGCIIAAVNENAYETLEEQLQVRYYEPLNLEPEVFITYPCEGSGPVLF